jgi:hypothetical protein
MSRSRNTCHPSGVARDDAAERSGKGSRHTRSPEHEAYLLEKTLPEAYPFWGADNFLWRVYDRVGKVTDLNIEVRHDRDLTGEDFARLNRLSGTYNALADCNQWSERLVSRIVPPGQWTHFRTRFVPREKQVVFRDQWCKEGEWATFGMSLETYAAQVRRGGRLVSDSSTSGTTQGFLVPSAG